MKKEKNPAQSTKLKTPAGPNRALNEQKRRYNDKNIENRYNKTTYKTYFILFLTVVLATAGLTPVHKARSNSDIEKKVLGYILQRNSRIDFIDARILQQTIIRESGLIECRTEDEKCASMDKIGLLIGIIETESWFTRQARSRVGALGYMQLMPATARIVARDRQFSEFQIMVTENNITLGVKYFNDLLKLMKDVEQALLAYNAGPYAVRAGRGVPSYWKKVKQNHDKYLRYEPNDIIEDRAKDALISLKHSLHQNSEI